MSDGGIDAISDGDIVYQVKWSSKVEQNPATWLKAAMKGEREKIAELIREKGISRYILMTSVAGTTTAKDTGSMQKLQADLDEFSKELGIPVECWWQADIDAEVDAAPDSIKWSYQEMLAGAEAIRYLIYGAQTDGAAHEMRETLLKVMASQWRDDSKIKFSQLDMDRVNISDLFIDVQVTRLEYPKNAVGHFHADQGLDGNRSSAVDYMLKSLIPLTYLLGVPGQGKSTLGQYLCQLHRVAISPELAAGDEMPEVADPKLPLRVDLTDYSKWISGRDPFGDDYYDAKSRDRGKGQRSLENFLASLCGYHSGGRRVSVEQIQSLMDRYPTLVVLDGLDEVADVRLRGLVVDEINRFTSRLSKDGTRRRCQVMVTARPNASGLPEPDKNTFQTLEMCPLNEDLQNEFVNQWAALNGVEGAEKRRLHRTFQERTAYDHVAQLADNPMQLTILLFLISRKGDAVPISRTPLYTEYMQTLLDREVSKQQIERDHVPQVNEVTSFLGWYMQSGVEGKRGADRMTLQNIEITLMVYFRLTGGPSDRVEELFKTVTDRFWALASKVEGTFEFAVQPVREYFAAKYLAEWAGMDQRDPLPKHEVLRQLIKRNYWLNTARFYAGFANPNELAGLKYGLQEALEAKAHPLQERVAVWTLLSDGIFANKGMVQRDVAELLTDDLTIRLATDNRAASANYPRLGASFGGESLRAALLRDIAADPGHPMSLARVSMLLQHHLIDSKEFTSWWNPLAGAAYGTDMETAWLRIGARFGVPRLLQSQAERLILQDAEACRAALAAGASPANGTRQEEQLLRAVLDGWCSEVETAGLSEAGSLIRAMRPFWFIRLAEAGREGPVLPTEHFWEDEAGTSSRSDAFKSLVEVKDQYGRLQQAARAQAKGQKGTTEPWQNAAREFARVHGPCWLAADIAVIGAATQDTRGEGSIDKGGQPFGIDVDYGTFVVEVRRRPTSAWWQVNFDKYPDSLSRRTWAFALLATAREDIVLEHLGNVDAVIAASSEDEFFTLATSSGRLGATRIPRRLGRAVLEATAARSDRLALLVSHFASDLEASDVLHPLDDEKLSRLADSNTYNWAVARAITVRVLHQANAILIDGLGKLGQDCKVAIDSDVPVVGDVARTILGNSAVFPGSWVQAAERSHSTSNGEAPMADEAVLQGWVPDVPRSTR